MGARLGTAAPGVAITFDVDRTNLTFGTGLGSMNWTSLNQSIGSATKP
jgi:hypothetical protein